MPNITTNHTITYTNPAHVRGLIVVVVVVIVVDDDTIVFTYPPTIHFKLITKCDKLGVYVYLRV